jgi:hypothetical protein
MTLGFLRNKVVEVEPLSDGRLLVSWRLTDSLLDIEIQMKVQVPDLEIEEADARMKRYFAQECTSAPELIQKVVGVRIGPGLRKIVRGLMSGAEGCSRLTEGVLECGNAVILHFTLPQLQLGEKLSQEERLAATREMLKLNPRLVRSCIAFADDSPIMQGLGL